MYLGKVEMNNIDKQLTANLPVEGFGKKGSDNGEQVTEVFHELIWVVLHEVGGGPRTAISCSKSVKAPPVRQSLVGNAIIKRRPAPKESDAPSYRSQSLRLHSFIVSFSFAWVISVIISHSFFKFIPVFIRIKIYISIFTVIIAIQQYTGMTDQVTLPKMQHFSILTVDPTKQLNKLKVLTKVQS